MAVLVHIKSDRVLCPQLIMRVCIANDTMYIRTDEPTPPALCLGRTLVWIQYSSSSRAAGQPCTYWTQIRDFGRRLMPWKNQWWSCLLQVG